MSKHGFFIEKVRLFGEGLPDAEIHLKDGFNVVFGASNTGKTYIAQCIDFAFGRTKAPKNIPEASSYETVEVSIRRRDNNESIVLSRGRRGGDISYQINDGEIKTLKAQHSGDNFENVSAVLLRLCGLSKKRVTKNANGATNSLSFRNLSHLAIVGEEAIIKSGSPIHSKAYTENTLRQSVFRLLLTGVDDSAVVEKKEAKVSKAESRGKTELLTKLEADLRGKLSDLANHESQDDLKLRLDKLDSTVQLVSGLLSTQRDAYAEVERERKSIWTELQQVESRLEVLFQLQERFALLLLQYKSDLARLASIAEVGSRLNELPEERCVVCGALPEHHSEKYSQKDSLPSAVAVSAIAEREKVEVLLRDLRQTIEETALEAAALSEKKTSLELSLSRATTRLNNEFRPRISEALADHNEAMSEQAKVKELLSLHKRLEQIAELQVEAQKPAPKSDASIETTISNTMVVDFCQEIERLLKAWKLPGAERVTFSEEAQDIVIGDRDRSVDGKGVRAITHAAFTLSLNNYCVDRDMPTPSFVVIDSPLVVYREPDDGEKDFAPDVKANFYRQTAEDTVDRQVIVFENDDPPNDLPESIHVIHFSGSDRGRYGFIPTNNVSEDSDG